jgi:pyruvate/2-oxoglutarate dehydrogenase complex dihydrolipoamide acyltransferase (E2) component
MVHEVRMPVLSQTMIQGRVVEWILKEGEKVDKGALLVVVESDKATHELEAPDGGILTKILVEEGCEVDVNTVLAIISEAGESTKPKNLQAQFKLPKH